MVSKRQRPTLPLDAKIRFLLAGVAFRGPKNRGDDGWRKVQDMKTFLIHR